MTSAFAFGAFDDLLGTIEPGEMSVSLPILAYRLELKGSDVMPAELSTFPVETGDESDPFIKGIQKLKKP